MNEISAVAFCNRVLLSFDCIMLFNSVVSAAYTPSFLSFFFTKKILNVYNNLLYKSKFELRKMTQNTCTALQFSSKYQFSTFFHTVFTFIIFYVNSSLILVKFIFVNFKFTERGQEVVYRIIGMQPAVLTASMASAVIQCL